MAKQTSAKLTAKRNNPLAQTARARLVSAPQGKTAQKKAKVQGHANGAIEPITTPDAPSACSQCQATWQLLQPGEQQH